jgi:hypothetical protein
MLDNPKRKPRTKPKSDYWLQCGHARIADRAASRNLRKAIERKAATEALIKKLGLKPEEY